MSKFAENKFMIGFGAVTLAGAGTLAYLTYQASDKYEESLKTLNAAQSELSFVQRRQPVPSEAALRGLVTQNQEIRKKLDDLQQDFKGRVLPVVPIGKEAFQVQLRDSVARVVASFTERGVTLGKDPKDKDTFYLGYKEYQDKPPEDAAAPLLARQLKAITLVMDLLTDPSLQAGQLNLIDLKRERFTEERSRSAAPDPSAPPGGGRRLVEKTGFSIKFLASDDAFRKILNGIVANRNQLFIIRRITVQNEHLNSPQRSVPGNPGNLPPGTPPPEPAPTPATPGTPGTPTSPAPPGSPPAKSREYIFGKERVEATIDIEVLDFAEPEKRPGPAKKGPG